MEPSKPCFDNRVYLQLAFRLGQRNVVPASTAIYQNPTARTEPDAFGSLVMRRRILRGTRRRRARIAVAVAIIGILVLLAIRGAVILWRWLGAEALLP